MPAYSFLERFVPMVLDGSKPCTIRARRKSGIAKVGSPLYLFFGLRTKWCRKLRLEICTAVNTIVIDHGSIIVFSRRITDEEMQTIPVDKIDCDIKILTSGEMDILAWRDGFRPEGSTQFQCEGSWELMKRYWSKTHTLPFVGDHIHWIAS